MSRRLAAAIAAALLAGCLPAKWGANALLHPGRQRIAAVPALPHRDLEVASDGLTLRGWLFPAAGGPRRNVTVVYLHGVGDNRASGTGIAEALVRRGYDVVTFDSRAHGESDGPACTYGYHEKRDLSRVLDRADARRVVLVGVSLGAAVALQATPDDARIVGVVAAAPFSDLATIARERVRWVATEGQVHEALAVAEREGRFEVAAVSPLAAAPRIHVPVLLVHGREDRETSPDHARRLLPALGGPKALRIVEGAGHNDALWKVWPEVERWIDGIAEAER